MADYTNRREYERYPVSLKVQVSGIDEQGEDFYDNAALKDISGGGANMLTEQASRYYIGQHVNLRIFLPGAERLNAGMNGRGMVVWMGDDPERPEMSHFGSIGLCMDDLLAFEHLIEGGE